MQYLVLLLMFVVSSGAMADRAGITGHSGKEAKKECGACHQGGEKASVIVQGPKAVKPGSTSDYTITINEPFINAGGFNAAATDGQFDVASKDIKLVNNELTHTDAKWPNAKGDVVFKFHWIAPKNEGKYKIYVAAAAVDDDESKAGDGAALTEFEIEVSANASERVNDINAPPVGVISGPPGGLPGNSLYFNATRSTDDGKIVSFEWDFGDGEKGKGESVTHRYAKPGTYYVALTVKDDKGEKAVAGHNVNITKLRDGYPPPIALAGGPYDVLVGEPVELDATQSKAGKGYLAKYQWDYGDGSTGEGPKTSHAYFQPGLFQVILTVEDSEGHPVSTNAYVKVNEGSTAKIAEIAFAEEITLIDGKELRLPMGIVINGFSLPKGQQVCGTISVERNGMPHDTKPVCLEMGQSARVMVDYVITKEDPAEIEWTAVVNLDNGATHELSRMMKVKVQ